MAQKTVLIIDDEQGYIEPLVDALLHEGYRVLTAENGADGLATAQQNKIDLAIIDVMMPPGPSLAGQTSRQKTGVYVVNELRRRFPRLQMCSLSVITDPETISEIQRNGVRFMRKGETSLKHVLETVKGMLATGPGSTGTIRRWSG